ncbi:MAG: F0F1 ATP synthase subunit B [Candidatus Saccharibacteria bacterium]|nr:F0F1 ATP synthase subunit B [Candidatus Saccharibacteria bacterium]
MIYTLFAEAEVQATGIGVLGISASAFITQFISFLIVFILLRQYAFKPIGKLLEERRKTIDDGVKMGLVMEKEKAKLDTEIAKKMREARLETDKIIANAHKDARDVIREAEKSASRKTEAMLSDAEVRIEAETERAKMALEKDIIGLISEATEAIVGEKVDMAKDGEIIDKILKRRAK